MTDSLKQYADIPIRLIIGFHLIYGTQDNVFSWERMIEFRNFLEAFGVPLPLVGAIASVYAQFICGILFIIGWKVKPAAYIMIFNFLVAIFLVHLGDTYPNTFPALAMLAGSLFLAMNGAGKLSVENYKK
ncbi:MAG: hypothetical protein Tsb0034_22870 [Ekhidna sp.]